MKNNLGSQKTCQGQAETVHAEVSFYNTPQYLRYHLMKSKCLHPAQLNYNTNEVSNALWKIIRKADAMESLNPAFSSLTLEVYLEYGKDPQINLSLAQDRTYQVSKQRGYRAAKQTSYAAKTCCN